ncbi:MAG TPA: BACON domain-containing carbohydrate-binding protein [Bryobacteraceae bacterium]|nr:BACON domain-containing carbohydrate-binding protein [Bryobacteraceae bacterium]
MERSRASRKWILTAAVAFCFGSALFAQKRPDERPNAPTCTYSLGYTSLSVPSPGGTRSVDLTTGMACGWSASVDVPWLTLVAGQSGTGLGTITFAVAANIATTSRVGHLTVQGQTLTITEVAVLGPVAQVQEIWMSNAQVPSTVKTVSTAPCNPAPSVVTTFLPTDAAAYVFVDVTQVAQGDVISSQYFAPDGTQYTNAGSSYTVPAEAQSVCVEDQGMKIVGAPPANLPGLWTVKVFVNSVWVITANFTITGTSNCSYGLSYTSLSVPPAGGAGNSITVTTTNSCAWTAVSNVLWITITAGSSGAGPGTTIFTVGANPGDSRTAFLNVAGQPVAITQVATGGPPAQLGPIWMTRIPFPNSISSCNDASVATTSYAPTDAAAYLYVAVTQVRGGDVISDQYFAPDGTLYAGAGGTVTAPPLVPFGCWEDPGIMIRGTPAANKTGLWTVKVQVNGVLVITTSFTMLAGSNCTYAIGSTAASFPATGGSATVAVTADPGCPWTASASPGATWVHITSGASGIGSGSVGYSVDVSSVDTRTATIVIAGQAFTVSQVSGLPIGPVITPGGVADPWTYTKGIAPGAWVSIYGSNLANATQTWSPTPGQTLATTLAGVSVTVDGIAAAPSYVSPTLVNVLVPSGIHVGQVQIVVANNSVTGPPYAIQSTAFLPAIYSNAAPGTSPPRYYVTAVDPLTNELVGNPSADPRVTRAPRAGDIIDLYALGLGPATQFPTDADFTGAFPLTATVNVVLGGASVAPSFAALVAPGLYQMRIIIPATLAPGDQPILLDPGGGVESAQNVFLSLQR